MFANNQDILQQKPISHADKTSTAITEFVCILWEKKCLNTQRLDISLWGAYYKKNWNKTDALQISGIILIFSFFFF